VLTTDQKGAIAETGIVHAAIKLGIDVYRPAFEGGRYDFIFDLGGELARVQCKWACRRGEVLVIPCYSSRRAREGLRRRVYTVDEIDAIAAYCPESGRCYFIQLSRFDGRTTIQLRLTPPRNNQRKGINWAEEYEFSATLAPHGAVAQLGERRHGMAEVRGSIPLGSTVERSTAPLSAAP
jgi:hypothetical protein